MKYLLKVGSKKKQNLKKFSFIILFLFYISHYEELIDNNFKHNSYITLLKLRHRIKDKV